MPKFWRVPYTFRNRKTKKVYVTAIDSEVRAYKKNKEDWEVVVEGQRDDKIEKGK